MTAPAPKPCRLIHVSIGGPLRLMKMPNGRYLTFEDHRIFGPSPVRASDGELYKRGLRPSSPFWALYEAWHKAGKPVDSMNRCIVSRTPDTNARKRDGG